MGQAFDLDRMQRRFAEVDAALRAKNQAAAPATRSEEVLTSKRPFLSETPARVAPMSESENMRNIDRASAEILTFPNMRAPLDEGAFLALASITLSRKSSRRALARCERRVTRAVERIERSGLPDSDAAVAALGRACAACGKCERLSI